MPNHVANKVFFECSDEKAKEIKTAVMYDPNPDDEEYTGFGTFDFNKLIPMHPALMIEYLNGECVGEYVPESETESLEFACSVWGDSPEDYGMVKSADGTSYVRTDCDSYDVVELFGKPALFANERLSESNIPAGLYVCHVRGDDLTTGGFAELAPKVLVNHYGSVITKEPIDFGKKGYIAFTEETDPHFTGESATFAEFMKEDFDIGNGENPGADMKLM